MREPAVSLSEIQFQKALIGRQQRLDGRSSDEYRPCRVDFGAEYGVCVASIGGTRALCQVTASLDRPSETRPAEGKIQFKIDLPSLASPGFELGKQSPFQIDLNRLLDRAIVKSRCVDVEELCVRAGEKCWTLRCDVTALADEGNLTDCLCLAAIGALTHFRRPEVTVDGSEVTVHTADEKAPVRLTLHHKPFTVSFGYVDHSGSKCIILDPTRAEQHVLDGTISIAVNKHREICALHLSGQSELAPSKILESVKTAVGKVSELQQLIDGGIKKDDKMRKKGIVPRLSTDLFDAADVNGLMMMDEMAKVIADCSKASQHVPTNHDEVKIEVPDENDVKMEQQNEQAKEVAPGVHVADSPNWNEVEELIDDSTSADTSQATVDKDEKMEDCDDDEEDEEESVTHVKSEFS